MRRLAALLFTAVMMLGSLAIAQAPTMTQFSSDMTMKSARGENMTGKYYMGDRQIRMDMSQRGMNVSMITDLKARKSYMLMVDQKMFMEHSLDDHATPPGPGAHVPRFQPECDPDHFTCKSAGTETVNGRLAEKWVYTAKDAANEAENQTVWVDTKIHTPVRVMTGDGSQMDFTNIKEGRQDASLFKVPDGFQPFNPMMMGRPPKR
jgi:outer membrane lipoprotein-sorting protein